MKFENYKGVDDIKKLSNEELNELAQGIREFFIKNMTIHGGHLGSNLAIVELTLALLKNFNINETRFLFDVGYQADVIRVLTDRRDLFENSYKFDGYGPFQELVEGDPYSGGHTSISTMWAGGYVASENKEVIEIIGDGSLATSIGLGGMLNFNPDNEFKKSLFIFNDNKQGIGKNKFNYLNWEKIATGMNYKYIEVKDGHSFEELQKAIDEYKKSDKTVFLHVHTIKAKGIEIENPDFAMHYKNGQVPVNPVKTDGPAKIGSSKLMHDYLEKRLSENKDCYVLNAGLVYALGLSDVLNKHPKNFIDTGISEEVAIVQACALANDGKEVYVMMRASFIQRCYDQFIHDIARNNPNMTILIAYSGDVDPMGDSHHNIFDINMYNSFKNIKVYHPITQNQLELSLKDTFKEKGVKVVRYCDLILQDDINTVDINKWIKVTNNNADKVIITYSSQFIRVKDYLDSNNITDVDLIYVPVTNPLDLDMIKSLSGKKLYFYEPIHGVNGLGYNIKNEFNNLDIKVYSFTLPALGMWLIDKMLENSKMDMKTVFSDILSK